MLLELEKIKQDFSELKKLGLLIDINRYNPKKEKSETPSKCYWRNKRVLITGVDGMVGSTIADVLISLGAEVCGTIRRRSFDHYKHQHTRHNLDKMKFRECDLCDYGQVLEIMREIQPDVIFHQAAESFVPLGLDQPQHVVENNCVSTTNILEASRMIDVKGIQLACSSEQYGFVKSVEEIPIKETQELRPTSTYAATKVFTENVAKAYYHTYKLPVVITRTFNQEGPRRGDRFFTARIAKQIASKPDKIIMGNPNAVRDFTHVYDTVNAQILAVEKANRNEVYNICSGVGITTGDYASLALNSFGMKIPIFVDTELLRAYERKEALFDGFIGDNSKFCEKTGWKPTRSLIDIIKDGVRTYE